MKTEFFRDQYAFELEQREHLRSAVSTPLTVAILGGVFGYLAHHFAFGDAFWTTFFAIALIPFLLCLLWAIYALFRSNAGYIYKQIATSEELARWYQSLLVHFGDEGRADSAFDGELVSRFVEATTVNARNNASKSAYLATANKALAIAAAAAFVAAVHTLLGSTQLHKSRRKFESSTFKTSSICRPRK